MSSRRRVTWVRSIATGLTKESLKVLEVQDRVRVGLDSATPKTPCPVLIVLCCATPSHSLLWR